MERRKFTREFKLEAVRLIKDRGVSYAQAGQDLGVHQSQLRSWVKAFAEDPQHSFPGQGQMKPEQLEIARLKREVTKLKAERDILKTGGLVVRGARCLAGWVLCLADTTAQSAQPKRRGARCEGSRQLPCQRSDLRRQARVARYAGGRGVVRSASDRAVDAATGPQSTSATASPAARSG